MGFSREGYWSGLPFPSQEICPDPAFEPWSPALQADSLPSEPPRKLFSSHVYGLFLCLPSYLLHARPLCLCVKKFLPDMSYVTGLLKASNELLCIKSLASCLALQRSLLFLLPTINHSLY